MKKKPTKRVSEYLDYDYLSKLSVSERKWLQKFNSHYYFGFTNKRSSKGENRENYNRVNRARRDIFNTGFKSDFNQVKSEESDSVLIVYYKQIIEKFYKLLMTKGSNNE